MASSGEMTPPWGGTQGRGRHLPRFHHSRPQPLPQQLEHPLVRDPSSHQLHQARLVDRVEVALDVGVHDVSVAAPPREADRFQGLRGAASRAEPVGPVPEPGLEDRLEHDLGRHLHHTVAHRRDAQRPLLPIRLRDVPPPHRLRSVLA